MPDGRAYAKRTISDFAIFGGSIAFEKPLHVGTPNIGDRARFEERMRDIFDRRWLTNFGRYVQEFEQRIADYSGVKHCIAVCNGTIGLEIAIRVLGLHGEVIVPAFTFVATAHALQWQEITPVFADVDPSRHTLDATSVEGMITPRTSAILGVHVWGNACPVEALAEIAARRKLHVLYDAAHAFGCSHNGRPIGGFGEISVLSFHATKVLNSFEGGAILTNDDSLAAKVRLMVNFGFTGYDQVEFIGTNGKMSEASAAMGLTNLEALDRFLERNIENHREYERGITGIPGITLLRPPAREQHNHQYVVVTVDRDAAGIDRDTLVRVLQAENVIARRYFYPGCHRMEPYRSLFPHAGLMLPNTEALTRSVLCLPTGTAVDARQIEGVCSILRSAQAHGREISSRVDREAPPIAETVPAKVPHIAARR